MTTERVEHMAGGQGHTLVKRLFQEKVFTAIMEHSVWCRPVM